MRQTGVGAEELIVQEQEEVVGLKRVGAEVVHLDWKKAEEAGELEQRVFLEILVEEVLLTPAMEEERAAAARLARFSMTGSTRSMMAWKLASEAVCEDWQPTGSVQGVIL